MKRLKHLLILSLLAFVRLATAEIVMITPQGFQSTSTAYTNTYISQVNPSGGSTFAVVIRSGEVARVVYKTSVQNSQGNYYLTLIFGTNINDTTFSYNPNGGGTNLISYGNASFSALVGNRQTGNTPPFDVIVGPGFLRLDNIGIGGYVNYVGQGIVTAQITRNDETIQPSGAILVPADSSGSVQVIMESSTNLIAWSSALPGTYGSTSQNKFFRLRAVHQSP